MAQTKLVKLSEILTWNDYFINNDDTLFKLQPTAIARDNDHFVVDIEINNKVSIYESDITCLQIDGIVSANNADLVASGGVSAMIDKVGGPELVKETKSLNGCKCGEAKTTSGYNLPAKYVVHTVGPQTEDSKLLESCYKICLQQMEQKKMKSLAFCCVATGSYGYPNDRAVHVALKTIRKWLEDQKAKRKLHEIDRIIFSLFAERDKRLYKSWMQIYFPYENPEGLQALSPIPGFIRITTNEPDMITLDDDPFSRRAVMPCGHVIGPESMTKYAKDVVSSGKYVFICSGCDSEWAYFLVRHVAHLTPDEMQEIEKKISDNYLKKASGMQTCPGCQIYCFRRPGVGNCVRCATCTKANGRVFDFCWACLKQWKGSGSTGPCGNQDCDGNDKRIGILQTCPVKQIQSCKECPSIRGCPKCGMLIDHRDKCGHVYCTYCKLGFCFICLRPKTPEGEWPCAYQGTCILAPRQISLPGTNCYGNDKRIGILLTCPVKQIHSCKECPSIRGCPKCGMLIEHRDKCSHIDCTNCKLGFCFICLRPKTPEGVWPCSHQGTCVLAPRQTSLPGTN